MRIHKGEALAEYILIYALITAVCVFALSTLGKRINSFYNDFNEEAGNAINNTKALD